jgi:hypothetical protein
MCICCTLCVFVVSYVYLLYLMCICCILCVFVVSYVYLLYLMCIYSNKMHTFIIKSTRYYNLYFSNYFNNKSVHFVGVIIV